MFQNSPCFESYCVEHEKANNKTKESINGVGIGRMGSAVMRIWLMTTKQHNNNMKKQFWICFGCSRRVPWEISKPSNLQATLNLNALISHTDQVMWYIARYWHVDQKKERNRNTFRTIRNCFKNKMTRCCCCSRRFIRARPLHRQQGIMVISSLLRKCLGSLGIWRTTD